MEQNATTCVAQTSATNVCETKIDEEEKEEEEDGEGGRREEEEREIFELMRHYFVDVCGPDLQFFLTVIFATYGQS